MFYIEYSSYFIQILKMNPAQPVDKLDNIIEYYLGKDQNIDVSHSDLSEVIALIYITYNGCNNQGELLRMINDKCRTNYSEEKLSDYTQMINTKQIKLKDAVKELFTYENLEIYGI
jgi:hypothetical protein